MFRNRRRNVFYSYSASASLGKQVSRINMMNSKMYMLPDDVIEKIFRMLSFNDIVLLREVCLWFSSVAGAILNKKFMGLSEVVNGKIETTKTICKNAPNLYCYMSVLRILKSEVEVMEACCLEYVLSNMFFFSGGKILDLIDSILSYSNSNETIGKISQLIVLVDDFLDYFEFKLEPILLKKSDHLPMSWFGKKMVDLLYCCFNSDKTINISTDKKCFQIKAVYTAKLMYSIKEPPMFPGNTLNAIEMRTFLRYIRNHIRWNNTMSIQKQDSSNNLLVEKISHKNSSIKITQRVILKDANGPTKGKFVITLFLRSLNYLAPMLGQNHFSSQEHEFRSLELNHDSPLDYDFSALVEIGHTEQLYGEKINNEKTIEIVQVNNTCYYSVEINKE